jgi:hypothetical protein
MKTITFVIVFLLAAVCASAQQWERLNNFPIRYNMPEKYSPNINLLSDGKTIYAYSQGGSTKTANNTWISYSSPFYRSTDYGRTWTFVDTAIFRKVWPERYYCDVKKVVLNGSTLYAIVTDRLYRSTDRGDSWQWIRPKEMVEPTLTIDTIITNISCDNGNILFTLNNEYSRSAYLSTDDGASWKRLNNTSLSPSVSRHGLLNGQLYFGSGFMWLVEDINNFEATIKDITTNWPEYTTKDSHCTGIIKVKVNTNAYYNIGGKVYADAERWYGGNYTFENNRWVRYQPDSVFYEPDADSMLYYRLIYSENENAMFAYTVFRTYRNISEPQQATLRLFVKQAPFTGAWRQIGNKLTEKETLRLSKDGKSIFFIEPTVMIETDKGYIFSADFFYTFPKEGSTGVEEHNASPVIRIIPNPASESFTAYYPVADATLTLKDIFGRSVIKVTTSTMSSGSETFSASGLAAGVYYLEYVTIGGNRNIEKLIIVR